MQEEQSNEKTPVQNAALNFLPKGSLSNKPAYLHVEADMALHTRFAQQLFDQSWQRGRLGLLQFAKAMTALWNAAQQDDPYADWHLLKTYQALCHARQKVQGAEEALTQQMASVRGLAIKLSTNERPLHCPLRFITPFGFIGAQLLAEVDYVFRQFLTLGHLGVPISRTDISIPAMTDAVQEAFAVPLGWQFTGVTRQGIKEPKENNGNNENNVPYEQAKALWGDVPDAVLKQEVAFSFFPAKKQRPGIGA